MASVVETRRLDPLDWARHESKIRQLYVGDGMDLSAVRNKMAKEYGFHASKSQFETQLKKWGLRKNHTSAEWKIVTQNLQCRQLVGKKTAVFYNGQLIPDVKVQRETSRYGSLAIRKRQNHDCHSPMPPVPPRFSLRTPPPQRILPCGSSKLPIMQMFEDLDSYYTHRELYRPPFTYPAYINPQVLTRAGDSASKFWVPSGVPSGTLPYPAPPTSQLVRGDKLSVSEPRHLLAILPQALHTPDLIGSSDDASMEIQGPPFLYNPQAKMLLFSIANNFAGMDDLSHVDVWASLKAKAGTDLLKFLHQLPLSSQDSRAVLEKLFQCAIEADDTAAVEILLESPEIRIDVNEVVCRSRERGRETALEFAASRLQVEMVGVLLRHDADVNKCVEPFVKPWGHMGGALARSLVYISPVVYPQIRNLTEDPRPQLVHLFLHCGAIVDTPIIKLAIDYSEPLSLLPSSLLELLLAGRGNDHIDWAKSGLFHGAIKVLDNGTVTRLCQKLVQNRPVLEILRGEPLKSGFEKPVLRDEPRHFLDVIVLQANIRTTKMLLVEYDFPITEMTLTYAVRSKSMELVKLLLERGAIADPASLANTYPKLGRLNEATPLSEAIRLKEAGIVKLLEEYGAFRQIMEATRYCAALVAAFQSGDVGECLVEAIRLNQDELAFRLLELGANPNTDKSTNNPLSVGLRKGKSELIRALLNSPDIDLTAHSTPYKTSPWDGQFSPLVEAVKRGDRSIIIELIMAGAPLNRCDDRSITSLIMAIRANDKDLVELLLRFGASVNFSVAVYVENKYDIRHPVDDSVSSNESVVDPKENNINVDSGESEVDLTANNYVLSNKSDMDFSFENDVDLDEDEDSVSSDEDDWLSIRVITPLIAGVMNGDIEMISFLLSNGADPSHSGALVEAVNKKNAEIMDFLLEKFHERYPRGKADYGLGAMLLAVCRRDLPLVAKLLANGVGTPLLSALEANDVEWYGYDKTPFVEAIELDGETGFAVFRIILDAMIERNTVECLDAIVYRRRWYPADRVDNLENDINRVENETALLVAIKTQNFDKVQLLVEKGADVNRSTVLGVKRTPLQKAAQVGDFRIVEYLINQGADVNAPPARTGGATALQFACIYGYAGIVNLLLQHGADPDAAPAISKGRTALEGAAEQGRLDTVAILLNAGVKVDGDHRPQFERAIQRAQDGPESLFTCRILG